METGLSGSKIFVRTYDSKLNKPNYETFTNSSGGVSVGLDIKKTSDGGYILTGMKNLSNQGWELFNKLRFFKIPFY